MKKKILFNHPFILDKLEVDLDPLFFKYKLAIKEKKLFYFLNSLEQCFKM